MASVPTSTMRETLTIYFRKRGWNPMKLGLMSDNQIVAVYMRYQGLGFPEAPAKKPSKAPAKKSLPVLPPQKNQAAEQICMF